MESITPLLTGLLPDNSFLHEAKQTGNQPSARSTNSATLNKHPHPESSKGLSGSPSFAKHSVNDSYQGAEIYILFEKAYLKTRKTIPDGWCHPWLWTVCNCPKTKQSCFVANDLPDHTASSCFLTKPEFQILWTLLVPLTSQAGKDFTVATQETEVYHLFLRLWSAFSGLEISNASLQYSFQPAWSCVTWRKQTKPFHLILAVFLSCRAE